MRLPILLLLAASGLVGCSGRGAGPAAAPVTDQRSVAKLDLHAHYWQTPEALIPQLDAWNMRALLVNVTSDTARFREHWLGMQALHAAHPDRFILCATFDPFRFNEPDFAARTIEQLRGDIARGARMVKVWKNVGMEVKDERGRYVQIDHPRFQPIWDFLAEAGIPVLAHIAEPLAAWQPLDERSPHYGYYSTHPQYHAHQHPEIPRWETIIAARDRWVERNPGLVIVGAHLGSLEHDVDEVARRLDAYPNFHVETAARFNNLAMQPSDRVRAFMIRYQDRIMYGTDLGEGHVSQNRLNEIFSQHWAYLASPDTVLMGNPRGWNTRTPGLSLPRPVLEKIYARNAERVLRLSARAALRPTPPREERRQVR